MSGQRIPFVKGHGTQNNFVVLLDPDAELDLTPTRVRMLCDRRRGLGADGVLRAVPTRLVGEVHDQQNDAEWFMDYRNADGSTAEMCGNGARVFAQVLMEHGLVKEEEFRIATRGGTRSIRRIAEGFSVNMGAPRTDPAHTSVKVTVNSMTLTAVPVWFPNPHAVSFLDSLETLGPVLVQPFASPATLFPDGANYEFAVLRAENHVAFRVHERGVGETASCGTGACAVAWAYRRLADEAGVVEAPVTIDVAGGTLVASREQDGSWDLAGPVEIVADGILDNRWWETSYGADE